MNLINDIPVIGGILESFRIYFVNTYDLINSRSIFFDRKIYPLDHNSFKDSMKYFELGIVIGFLFLVPFFIKHHDSASKFIFVLRQVIAIFIYSYFIHLAFIFLNVKNSKFKSIVTLMGYVWGLMFPLNFILMLPILIEIGPSFIFDSTNTGEWLGKVSEVNLWFFSLLIAFGGIAFLIIWLSYILSWLPKTFNITKEKVIGGLLLGGGPSGLIIAYILGPLFRYIEEILSDWLIAV